MCTIIVEFDYSFLTIRSCENKKMHSDYDFCLFENKKAREFNDYLYQQFYKIYINNFINKYVKKNDLTLLRNLMILECILLQRITGNGRGFN